MHNSYRLLKNYDKGYVWSVPKKVMDHLSFTENQQVSLKCGSASAQVKIKKLSRSHNMQLISLSNDALEALGIPDEVFFQINTEDDGSYRLGPVIGILTFPGHIPDRLNYYRLYAKRNIQNGLLYVFRGRDIDKDTKRIEGYYYDFNAKQWKSRKLPYPDSVIDRCYPNPYKYHSLLEKAIGPHRIFNKKSMIDKLAFYQVLGCDNYLRNYTPETRLLEHITDIERFLNKYTLVFLKPTNGMKGMGIVSVRLTRKGALECNYSKKGKYFSRVVPNPSEISPIIMEASGRKRPYILQQGIKRLEYQGGPFSFRTWAMKNREGKWTVPGMFAKGSFGKGFLTNFTAGAKLIPLKDIFAELTQCLKCTREHLVSTIVSLTLKTAEILDEKYGPLGELGLDIVFDKTGKPWVIEANGNPGNIPVFIQKEYPEWPNKVFQYPLDYATYLSGFLRLP